MGKLYHEAAKNTKRTKNPTVIYDARRDVD